MERDMLWRTMQVLSGWMTRGNLIHLPCGKNGVGCRDVHSQWNCILMVFLLDWRPSLWSRLFTYLFCWYVELSPITKIGFSMDFSFSNGYFPVLHINLWKKMLFCMVIYMRNFVWSKHLILLLKGSLTWFSFEEVVSMV